MRRPAVLPAAIALVLASLAGSSVAVAQSEPDARLHGTIVMGTAEEGLTGTLRMELIILEGSDAPDALEVEVEDGRYDVTVPGRPGRTYVPHVMYEGVSYFAEPVSFATAAEAERSVVVYATTRERPDGLRIAETVVTVEGSDPGSGRLLIHREDFVENPSDRVYVGDSENATLVIPAPDGTEAAIGENPGGNFVFNGGAISTSVAIHAQGYTAVVTRYLVQYDAAADQYTLRITAPLPTLRIEVATPSDIARNILPQGDARLVEEVQLDGSASGQGNRVLRVVALDGGIEPGRGLIVEISGIAPLTARNPLTERTGAVAGVALVLLLLAGAAAISLRRSRLSEAA